MATTLYLACISLISRQVVFYLSRLDDQRIFDAHSAEAALVALLPACAHAAVRADAARRAEAANPSPNPNPNRNPDPKPAPNPSPAPNPAPDPNPDPDNQAGGMHPLALLLVTSPLGLGLGLGL